MEQKQPSILFLALARDCEASLPTFFSHLATLRRQGLSCNAIIGENGSRDRTRKLIEQTSTERIALLDTSFVETENSRAVRIAMGRQALFDAAIESRADQDYICVVDLDEIILEPPKPETVMKVIRHLRAHDCLFAIGATSVPVYYDLISLQAPGHDYSTLRAEIRAAKRRPLSYYQFFRDRIYSNQRLLTRQDSIVCTSSFNGCCIYNASDYWLGNYRAWNEADVCEHLTFNLSIAQATGKHMLIMPELTVQAPTEHTPVDFGRFWRNRLKRGVLTFRTGIRGIRRA